MTDLQTFEDLADALRSGTDDDGPDRAAVDLLIETRVWLENTTFVGEHVDFSEEEPGAAWVDWEGVSADLHEGDLVRPDRELVLLRIALSLVGTAPVSLAVLEDLTLADAATVARAVVTAARVDQRVEVTVIEERSW